MKSNLVLGVMFCWVGVFGCGVEPIGQEQLATTKQQPLVFTFDKSGENVDWNVHQSRWFLRRGFEDFNRSPGGAASMYETSPQPNIANSGN